MELLISMVYLERCFRFPAGGCILRQKKVLAACAIIIFVSVVLINCSRADKAPNFKLRNLNGRVVTLDQYKGKVVLLDFWATWCGPCRMTMPLLERLQKEYPKGMTLLAINLQEPEDVVRDYVREQKIDSEVLLDEDGVVGSAYGADMIPMQVLIDKEGNIRRVGVGLDTIAQIREDIRKLQ
jgi:thiol-disulfide isomerase/thioredoxin